MRKSSTELQYLHVASFGGNVGDNASHNGLRSLFKEVTGVELIPDRLEIRKSYTNYDGPDRFDWSRDFASRANAAQLTIVGGGNYFAPNIGASRSGTTVDLGISEIQEIRRPVVFHAIGFDAYQGWTDETVARFKQFLAAVADNPNTSVVFRNDGSRQHLRSLLGDAVAEESVIAPDPGFFVQPDPSPPAFFRGLEPYIAVNLAKDMIEKRFQGLGDDAVSAAYDQYLRQLREWVLFILEKAEGFQIVFVPHIITDLQAISDLVAILPESLRRARVHVAPYLSGEGAERCIFSIYQNAVMVAGNRFHTSVCCVGMGVPTIGLATYRKLGDLYQELELADRCIVANQGQFLEELVTLTEATLSDLSGVRALYQDVGATLKANASLVLHRIAEAVQTQSRRDDKICSP